MKCIVESCDESRWGGPSGTKYLTMCEYHQKEYWRKTKAAKRPVKKLRPIKEKSKTKRVPKPPPVEVKAPVGRWIKFLIVDHNDNSIKRFIVPLEDIKRIGNAEDAARIVNMYKMTGHMVIEVPKDKEGA